MNKNRPWITAILSLVVVTLGLQEPAAHFAELVPSRNLLSFPWTIWTAHLAHWSWAHAAADLILFGLVGAALEQEGRWSWALFLIVGAGVVSAWVCWQRPELSAYRGLSGITYGAMAAWAIHLIAGGGRSSRGVGGILLGGIVILAWGPGRAGLWSGMLPGEFVVISEAHQAGVVVGALWAAASATRAHMSSDRTSQSLAREVQ